MTTGRINQGTATRRFDVSKRAINNAPTAIEPQNIAERSRHSGLIWGAHRRRLTIHISSSARISNTYRRTKRTHSIPSLHYCEERTARATYATAVCITLLLTEHETRKRITAEGERLLLLFAAGNEAWTRRSRPQLERADTFSCRQGEP